MQTFQFTQFFFKYFGNCNRPFLFKSFLTQFLYLQLIDIPAQLFLYRLNLLLEEIFFLLLVYIFVCLHLDGSFQLHQLILAIQDKKQTVSTIFQVPDQKKLLFFGCTTWNIATREIYQIQYVLIVLYRKDKITRRIGYCPQHLYCQILYSRNKSFKLAVALIWHSIFQNFNLSGEIRFRFN